LVCILAQCMVKYLMGIHTVRWCKEFIENWLDTDEMKELVRAKNPGETDKYMRVSECGKYLHVWLWGYTWKGIYPLLSG